MVDLHQVKTVLQSHFSDGCVLVIGSGLSCAEGLPSMESLAAHLINTIGEGLGAEDAALWESAKLRIADDGLESALLATAPTPTLEAAIAEATTSHILPFEKKAISEVFSGERVLSLSRLIPRIVKPATGLPIITTNYDRLVEVAAEAAGLGIDNMFTGRFLGRLDEKESRLGLCRDYVLKPNRRFELVYAPRAIVYKPHGSLDWYLRDGTPAFHAGDLDGVPRLIITPGHNKFRNGYNSPFDIHRARANDAIDRANRFVVLGYGFNDDHLETHLSPAIQSGTPTLVITKKLSEPARLLAKRHGNVIAIDEEFQQGQSGTRVILHQAELFFPELRIWDLNSFVTEILEP